MNLLCYYYQQSHNFTGGGAILRKKEQKYKIWLFLGSYLLYILFKMPQFFYGNEKSLAMGMSELSMDSAQGTRIKTLSQLSIILMWGICFVLTLSMSKRKFFRSRAVTVLIGGVFVWLTWGVFTTFGGLSLFSDYNSYRALIVVIIFSTLLLMAIRIVMYYDLRREIVGITTFALGTTLFYAYVTHFNGLDFVESLSGIFNASGRYRESFGIVHYNTTGKLCLQYYIFMAIYGAILKEKYVLLRGGGG